MWLRAGQREAQSAPIKLQERRPRQPQLAGRGGEEDVALDSQQVLDMRRPNAAAVVQNDRHRLPVLQAEQVAAC